MNTVVTRHSALALITGLLACCALLVSGGCSRKQETQGVDTTVEIKPKPADTTVQDPTVMRVMLRVSGNNVELISAQPKRADAFERDLAQVIDDALSGKLRILQYQAVDANGAVLGTGRFTVPKVAVAEFLDPKVEHRIVRSEQPLPTATVVVPVKYSAAIAALEISELDPTSNAPPERWPAKQIGRVVLTAPTGVVR